MTASDYEMLLNAPRGFRVRVSTPRFVGVWVKVAEGPEEPEPFLFGMFCNTEDGRLTHFSNLMPSFEVLK